MRFSFHGMLLIILLSAGLTACGGEDKGPDRTQAPPLKPEERAGEPVSPAPPQPVKVSKETRETYQWYCTQCHGVEGKGDGINALHLAVPPRNHTKSDYLETRSDRQLFDTIKLGGLAVGRAPCMPAWGHTLDDDTIESLVRYIRELCNCEAI